LGKNLLNEVIISFALTTLLLTPVISTVLATYDYDHDYKGDFWYGLDAHVWGYYSGSYYMITQHKAERFGSALVGLVGKLKYLFYAYRQSSYNTGWQEASGNSYSVVYDERWGPGTLAGSRGYSKFYNVLNGGQWEEWSWSEVDIY